ncbi:hypothetical protein F0562_014724 [Nyssa sinensis]|uniref:SBP-type domain-containing protein n=1 Tax=Nyssa sinensis TaxID=561372 RepID=A0A5J4ZRX1_9ASTE|nr:hypothetical protein F0562_014724 [Nyssa sinensis]
MDDTMKQFQDYLVEVEYEAENLLLARHQLVENDRVRNANREALTALRKRARTTRTSVPSPFESIMKEIEGPESRPLVKELCATCGNHDSKEKTWMMFPGTDVFTRIPFHAAHTILEKEQTQLDYEGNKLQSYVKEKTFWISERGVLADKISPGVLRSMVTLTDKPKEQRELERDRERESERERAKQLYDLAELGRSVGFQYCIIYFYQRVLEKSIKQSEFVCVGGYIHYCCATKLKQCWTTNGATHHRSCSLAMNPPKIPTKAEQIFDHYTQAFNETLVNPNGFSQNHQHFHQPQAHAQNHNHLHSLYDPRAYASYPPPSPAMLSLESLSGATTGPSGFMVVPKNEPSVGIDFTTRIGLNLGGRTYFSSEDDFVNRLYRRSRPVEPGSINSPRCQAEGCNADLTHSKHYHRRHKVCEFHSKAATVIAAGLTQRFCQQCSRFHLLSEFDNGKRSCRKRLADHNRRRRKSQQPNQELHHHKTQHENAPNSSSENLERSPPDSGAHSSPSVTVAISPPRMSLDSFRQRSYQAAATTSSTLTSSLFFSNG